MSFFNQSAFELINIQEHNYKVEIKNSHIKDELSMGLFAKKDIKKNELIVIYFGDVLDEEELLIKYKKDKSIMKYIRKGYDFIVDGSEGYKTKNLNLSGVYVNDIMKLKSKTIKDMKHYHKSRLICNVEVVDTTDFPIYRARKDIKAGSELFIHYGINYWLLEMGVSPKELKTKYKKILKKFYN
jgi:hypothetical protein